MTTLPLKVQTKKELAFNFLNTIKYCLLKYL